MTLHRWTIAAVFLGLALSACRKDGTPGSCYRKAQSACVAFDGEHAAAGKRMCGTGTWTDGEGTCPTADRLGTCTREQGRIKEFLYGGPPNQYTRGVAKQVCETGGGVFEGT